jgi:hypothetical protein
MKMSDGWTTEKKKTAPRKKSEWLIDSGLVFLYTLFMLGCFLIGFAHRNLGDMQKWSNISGFLVIVGGLCIGYVLYDLRRTIAVLTICAFLGFAVISIVSVTLYFHSYTSYSYRTGTGRFDFETISPAALILTFVIGVFSVNILGAIVGNYVAERTRRREKRLTLRCSNCGTWNEEDAIHCNYCGRELKNRELLMLRNEH